jgi:hypothetical protein
LQELKGEHFLATDIDNAVDDHFVGECAHRWAADRTCEARVVAN